MTLVTQANYLFISFHYNVYHHRFCSLKSRWEGTKSSYCRNVTYNISDRRTYEELGRKETDKSFWRKAKKIGFKEKTKLKNED